MKEEITRKKEKIDNTANLFRAGNVGNITVFNNFYNDSDIFVINSGYQKKAQHSFGPHANNYHVLQFIIDGKGVLQIGNKEWQLKKNTLFYLPANTLCKYRADEKTPYEYYWISFVGKASEKILENCRLNNETPICVFPDSALKKNFISIFQNLYSEKRDYSYKILSEMYAIFDYIVEHSDVKTKHATYPPFISNAIAFMNSNYALGITVEDICKHLFINTSYFSALFKKVTGMSPSAYLIGLRMSNATILLKTSNLSVSNIAASVGMTPLAFTAAFKRYYSLTPSAYRNEKKPKIMNID